MNLKCDPLREMARSNEPDDRPHLKFVASQPCLRRERHPTEPHHLRFVQPRALGRKVCDQYAGRCAAPTIVRSTDRVTRRHGGLHPASTRSLRPTDYGSILCSTAPPFRSTSMPCSAHRRYKRQDRSRPPDLRAHDLVAVVASQSPERA